MTAKRWAEQDAADLRPRLAEHFADPPHEYRPAPWLAYTGSLRKEEVRRAIDHCYDQEIRSFFIFPVYGMEIEYLSDEWFDLVKDSVKYCAEKGMTVWIYDDYNWPSGGCGGKLITEHPEFNCEVLWGEISGFVKPGDEVVVDVSGEFLKALALAPEGGCIPADVELVETDGRKQAVWTNPLDHDSRLICTSTGPLAAPGTNSVANKGSVWQKDNTLSLEYIDLLDPDAVDCFIEMTYERYCRELEPYWGTTVKGFMTDEPSLRGQIHYSAHLSERFLERYGYRLEDGIDYLIAPGAEDGRQVRADYWRLVGDMFSKAWGRINTWCVEHGVDFTGHFLSEEAPGVEVMDQAASWPIRKHMSIPGMDVLFDTNYDPTPSRKYTTLKHNYCGLALTGKLVSAAARYTGSKRAFAEAYGGFPHWGTPADLTAQTHWTTAQGINFINDNTLGVSWKGFRKRMLWGKHFTMPWWDCYGDVVLHAGRCCLMSSLGRVPARVGLLYPVLSAQALTHKRAPQIPSADRDLWHQTNYASQQTAESLTRMHRDWEIVWEEILREATVRDGRLCVKDASFSVIVVPSAHCLEEPVLAKIEEFAAAGGTVVFVGALPSIPIDGMADLEQRTAGLLALDHVHQVDFDLGTDWRAFISELGTILDEVDTAPVVLEGPGHEKILTAHRRTDDLEVFHLVNMSDQGCDVCAELSTETPLVLWHPDDGKRYRLDSRLANGVRRTVLRFAPWEGYFLLADATQKEPTEEFPRRNVIQGPKTFHSHAITAEVADVEFRNIPERWDFTLEGHNMMALESRARLSEGGDESGEAFSASADACQEWARAEEDKLPFTLDPAKHDCYWHQATFFAEHVPGNLAVVVDSDEYVEAYLNGQRLRDNRRAALWDESNIAFDLGDRVKPGVNVLVFKVRTDLHYHPDIVLSSFGPDRLEPVVVTGDFGTAVDLDGLVRLKPPPRVLLNGDWRLQGLCGFSGCVTYAQDLEIEKKPGQTWLDLGQVEVFAELSINGQQAGRRGWPPYQFRIDEHLKDGPNRIEVRVKNTLSNVLRTSLWVFGTKLGMAPSGILGPVQIVHIGT